MPNEEAVNQPYGATTFHSYGHYGSTVFDPPPTGGRRLEINICDSCLVIAQLRVAYVIEARRSPVYAYKIWNPEEDN